MTWLLLPGDHPTNLLALMAAAWHRQPAQDRPADLVIMTSAKQSSQVLRELPPALSAHATHWPTELGEGFHPLTLTLPTGPVDVLLCTGEVRESLTECVCLAQHVWVGNLPDVASNTGHDAGRTGDRPLPALLSRLCAKGTVVTCLPAKAGNPAADSAADVSAWQAAGFVPMQASASTSADSAGHWHYAPRWPAPELPQAHVEPSASRAAIVIGAGLAGAATALCLIRKGWQVDLIDRYPEPAQGASALPTGLLSEHVTARDTLMSELSRVGMPLQRRELAEHVPPGAGWQATTVVNLKGMTAEEDGDGAADAPTTAGHTPLVLPAVVVRGSALVHAWLTQARATGRLREHWNAEVAQLQREPACDAVHDAANANRDTSSRCWQAIDVQGRVVASAPHVVLAAAYGSHALMLPHVGGITAEGPLRPVKGQMSMAPLRGDPLEDQAIRQHGVFVPAFADSGHPVAPRVWAMGSTYERGRNDACTTPESQARNAASLAAMHPDAHERMQHQMRQGEMVEWAQVRCASLDRLPLVGPLPSRAPLAPSTQLDAVPRETGLWSYCALGSRGLTLGMLAAQLLVARMTHGTWPVKKRHGLAMDPARFALKLARRKSG